VTSSAEWGTFAEIPGDAPFPGVTRRSFDSSGATVTRYWFDAGATFPLHRHPQEQITLVEEGAVEFSVAAAARDMHPGDWCVVPPSLEHSLTAGPNGAVVSAIIVPRREPGDPYQALNH
jgi:quercetin dioxygenase-like cupin family protein